MRDVGDYIREQRRAAQVSLRQLARLAGVSNPYLSQIERGLRKPSAEILQQIAKALRISAEQLYVQAGILDERVGDTEVVGAVLADTGLTERQKQVLLEIYESFRKENLVRATPDDAEPAAADRPDQPVPLHPVPVARRTAGSDPDRTDPPDPTDAVGAPVASGPVTDAAAGGGSTRSAS